MSTLLLFILFAFVAFAVWIGYTAYRSMQKKRGPVPPANTEPGAQPAETARQSQPVEQTGTPGAQPAERDRKPGAQSAEDGGTRPSTKPAERPRSPDTGAERRPPRPESEAGPKRRDNNEPTT